MTAKHRHTPRPKDGKRPAGDTRAGTALPGIRSQERQAAEKIRRRPSPTRNAGTTLPGSDGNGLPWIRSQDAPQRPQSAETRRRHTNTQARRKDGKKRPFRRAFRFRGQLTRSERPAHWRRYRAQILTALPGQIRAECRRADQIRGNTYTQAHTQTHTQPPADPHSPAGIRWPERIPADKSTIKRGAVPAIMHPARIRTAEKVNESKPK